MTAQKATTPTVPELETPSQPSLPIVYPCPDHPDKPLEFYCESEQCMKLICSSCVSNHSRHKITQISEAAVAFKAEFEGPKLSIEEHHREIHNYIAKVDESKQNLNTECDKAVQCITSYFEAAITMITEQKEVLVQQANQVIVDKLSELDKKKEMPLTLIAKAEKTLQSIDSIINEESPELFLSNKDKVMSDIEPILRDLKFIWSMSSPPPMHLTKCIPSHTTLRSLLPTKYGEIQENHHMILSGAGLESPSLHCINYIYCHTQSEVTDITVKLSSFGRLVSQSVIPELLPVFVEPNKDHYIIAYQPKIRGRYNLIIEVDDIVLPTCFFVPVHPRDLHKPIQTFINNNLSKCWAVATSSHEKSSELIYIGTKTDITVFDKQTQKLTGNTYRSSPVKPRQVSGICVGPDGSIYKSCHNRNKVIKYNLSGERVHAFSNHDMFDGPCGIAINRDHLYICNSGRNNILVYDLNTLDFIVSIGSFGNEPGHFIHCIDIAFDDNNRMYVIDTTNRVQVLDVNCIFQHYIGMEDEQPILKDPQGICVNGDYVYVTEKEASRVSVFSLDGQLVSHIGEGYLQSPCGIAVDLDGFVWVCDWEKEAVLVF